MGQARRIFLYGESIILASVGASLQREHHFEVVALTTPLPSVDELIALYPDVILFDVESGGAGTLFSLLELRPELLLLGVSPDGNIVRLWPGRQFSELTTRGLAALLQEYAVSFPPEGKGGL